MRLMSSSSSAGETPERIFAARFGDNGFHFSNDRGRFLSELNPLSATIAGAGLPGDESFLFQLVKRTYQ